MKKTILTLGILTLAIGTSLGQGWTLTGATLKNFNSKVYLPYSNGNNYIRPATTSGFTYFDGGGSVGIGHQSQATGFRLHVLGNTFLNGNVAIGTTNNQSHLLNVGGSARFTMAGNRNLELLGWNLAGTNGVTIGASIDGAGHIPLAFAASNFYFHSGNVGIGTNNTQGYRLAVNGSMIAEEIVVKLYSAWPDYVFGEKYDMKTLPEVEEFIQTNNHLPNVPSEKDVVEDGINLGEMDAILLRKIEELTLYVIAQQKEIEKLKNQMK